MEHRETTRPSRRLLCIAFGAVLLSGCDTIRKVFGGDDPIPDSVTATVRCAEPSRFQVPTLGTLDFGQVASLGQIWRTNSAGRGSLWRKIDLRDVDQVGSFETRVWALTGQLDVRLDVKLPALEAEVGRIVNSSARFETRGTVRTSAILSSAQNVLNQPSNRPDLMQAFVPGDRVVLVSSVLFGDSVEIGFDTTNDSLDNPEESTHATVQYEGKSVSVDIRKDSSCRINLQASSEGRSVLFYQTSCLTLAGSRVTIDSNCDLSVLTPASR